MALPLIGYPGLRMFEPTTPLMEAILNRNFNEMVRLVHKGVDVNVIFNNYTFIIFIN